MPHLFGKRELGVMNLRNKLIVLSLHWGPNPRKICNVVKAKILDFAPQKVRVCRSDLHSKNVVRTPVSFCLYGTVINFTYWSTDLFLSLCLSLSACVCVCGLLAWPTSVRQIIHDQVGRSTLHAVTVDGST